MSSDISSPTLEKTSSEQEILDYAQTVYKLFNKASRECNVEIDNIIPITKEKNVVSRSVSNLDTLLYVVNYKDSNGYAVLSAKSTPERLLGFIENGSYIPNSESNYINTFLNDASVWVEQNSTSPNELGIISPILKTKYIIEYITKEEVSPKIEVNWGRNLWEGQYCPNGDPGAASICVAQILSYFEPSISLKLDSNSTSKSKLDWTALKKHNAWQHFEFEEPNKPFTTISCSATEKAHSDLGYLCYDIALTSCAKFEANETYIEPFPFIDAVCSYVNGLEWSGKYFREEDAFKYETDEFLSTEDAINQLNQGVMAFATKSSYEKLYYWACDGYKQVDVYGNVYQEVKSNTIDTQWELIESNKIGEDLLLHFNWGDYGRCNGYFSFNVYKPSKGAIYDNPDMNIWRSDFEFTEDIDIYSMIFKKL